MELRINEVSILAAVFTILVLLLIIRLRVINILLHWIVSSSYYKKVFAWTLRKWSSYPNNATEKMRRELISELSTKLNELGGYLLEIGAGSGGNLKYMNLPEESSLIIVDYNPHMEKHFRENLKKYPSIHLKEFVVQSAESMSQIADNSVSVVLATQLLCSLETETLKRVLQEVKRILKPGGYYFFLEHVIDEPGTWRRSIQCLSCGVTGLWPLFLDGCVCDKETWQYIREAGFKSVSYQRGYGEKVWIWKDLVYTLVNYIARPRIWGFAQKGGNTKE